MTGIILAGGENRRMGKDKAFLMVAGKPLVEHVLDVLQKIFQRLIIVTNAPERYTVYGAAVVTDALGKRGPLTGIHAGLTASRDDLNFIVACDMPFLNAKLIEYMMASAEGYDVVVPKTGNQCEPLHALYHRKLLARIEKHVRRGSGRIQTLYRDARVRYITEEEIERFDPLRRSFMNLNTPEEYKEALCSDLGCGNYSQY